MSLLLLGLTGCVRDAPSPDLGACAEPPAGVYTYGQIGIGTCLAGPTDLALLADDRVLAVANANPWKDFTGGSILFLDLDRIAYDGGRTLVSDIAIDAIDMPSFVGAMAYAPTPELLLVSDRLSEGARTRESQDSVWFVDVSDPDAPALADIGDDDGASAAVGSDPSAITYDPLTDIAYVVNRTSHTVSMLDVGARPVATLPPGGPGRLEAFAFVDVDGGGSSADFVTLEPLEGSLLTSHEWDMRWNVASVRAWVPLAGGLARYTGNGESTWERSGVPLDVDLSESSAELLAISDPAFSLEDGVARLYFSDQNAIRSALTVSGFETWDFGGVLLEGRDDAWDATIGGPSVVRSGGVWLMFYDGGDGTTQAIGLAVSGDGEIYQRSGRDPVVEIDGASVSDPFVFYDVETAQWRMFFTVSEPGAVAGEIGQAVSDDLVEWTVLDDRFASVNPVTAAAVGRWNGRLHLYYSEQLADGWQLGEATSIDGYAWAEAGVPFVVEGLAGDPPGVALQVNSEQTFRLEDEAGDVFPLSLAPGDTIQSEEGGWLARVAVGHVAGPEEIDAAGVQIDAWAADVAWLTITGDDGINRIGRGERVGDDLVLDADPVLDPDDLGVDGVSSPVVLEEGGAQTLFFAREVDGVTSIARATSPDGLTWTADAGAVLTSGADWESVAMEPGSVQVRADGTIRLWYSGYDGAQWRIGAADSTDGESFTRVAGSQYAWTFDAGSPGDWNDSGVRSPFVVEDAGVERMWFAGFSGESWQIGYAERAGEDDEFEVSVDLEGTGRPALASALGGFGIEGVVRPVVNATEDGWEIWYTGIDGGDGRIGRGVAVKPDRVHRDLRLPSLADTWGFTAIPADDADAIDLGVVVDGAELSGRGCAALAIDDARGFLYVGCKLLPYVYVVDIRDDSDDSGVDLNYLDIEAVLLIETSTGADSGPRSLMVDPARGWLWGISDEPEAVYAIDLAGVEDDDDAEIIREQVRAMLPLPRSGERDEGVDTQSYVGPGQLELHPDGHHLFVTNFNNNSLTVFDLALGPTGMIVGEARDLGENPYSLRITADGTKVIVAHYTGEVEALATASTLAVIDADPESPTFLKPLAWVVNK